MKKIILALAVLASLQVANAQVKTSAVAKSNLDAAKAASLNEKKATKVGTWTKLGEAYLDAFDSPAGSAWVGASKQQLALTFYEKPSAVETVTLTGGQFTKEIYTEANFYFDEGGVLRIIESTKPICDNPLKSAAAAFYKAFEVDAKKSKLDDIVKGLESVRTKVLQCAYDQYTFGNFSKSADYFKEAYDLSVTEPLHQADTISLFYAAQMALWNGDNEKAKEYFTECKDKYNYETPAGDLHAKLAEIYLKEGQNEKAKAILEEGFESFPQGQSILIGLINYYLTNNEDPNKLFTLLDKAKVNEPNNASLYYVEGNINSELGNREKAIAAYEKCAEINPNYEFGYIGIGQLYYKMAIEIQEKAQTEMDDAKYMALVKEFEDNLKLCIPPFEKAYEITNDPTIKTGICEYLKNAAFRFRTEPEYQAIYEKYNAAFTSAQ